ncbi:nucleic acid-binding protein [Naviculisporaceae sp. PSN 640]
MSSIRRAALRSALSASRTVSSTTRSSLFASQIARKTISPITRPSAIISARFFSQTGRVANEEKPVEESEAKPAEEAVEAAAQPTEAAEEAVETAAQPTEAAEQSPAAQASEGAQEIVPGRRTPYGVFVRNLVYDATDEHLAALFEKIGKVNLAQLAKDAGGMNKGYGFVYFTNENDRQEAIRSLDNTFWHGRRIFVTVQNSNEKKIRGKAEPSRSLYIGNLPYETTDAQLNDLFSRLDGVLDVRVAVDRTTGWPRGFCHVDFKTIPHASAALEQLRGTTLGDRELKLDWAESRDRGDRAGQRNQGQRNEREGGRDFLS